MIIEDKKLYQVGGVVRDEILGIESVDVDFCYEGNAIEFAQNSGLNIVKTNPAFGTVRVQLGNKEIDIASTRSEEYP
ncbi:tRNA nucleotidyltransferase, partial [bacterium]|nr:tRNA nucleotidyltransferase [bacterium]